MEGDEVKKWGVRVTRVEDIVRFECLLARTFSVIVGYFYDVCDFFIQRHMCDCVCAFCDL